MITEDQKISAKPPAGAVHTKCLICESGRIRDLAGYEDHDLVRCSSCGFVFMRKIPTMAELENYYSVYAYGSEQEISEPTRLSIESLIDFFEKYRKNNRMLDVGCGQGWILELAKKRGWEVYGTEFSPRAIEICRNKGIKMYPGVLDPAKMDIRDFDVIISSETIEHINNPLQEVTSINELLRRGGLIYITTPNFNSYLRHWLKSRYHIITYPEHLSYYTKKTLDFLLDRKGFKKIKMLTTGISISIYQLSTRKENTATSTSFQSAKSADEKIRMRMAGSPTMRVIKKMVDAGLSLLGLGMTLKAFYVKK